MRPAWLAAALFTAAAPAAQKASLVAAFSALQEAPIATPEELAEQTRGDGEDVVSAARSLNEWKVCVVDGIGRWAPLHHGPALLIDGAIGRCADLERHYRDALIGLSQDGRRPVDAAMARNLTGMLRDAWRSRLTAMALDRELAALPPPINPPVPIASGDPKG
jgi:hypothetical protein